MNFGLHASAVVSLQSARQSLRNTGMNQLIHRGQWKNVHRFVWVSPLNVLFSQDYHHHQEELRTWYSTGPKAMLQKPGVHKISCALFELYIYLKLLQIHWTV